MQKTDITIGMIIKHHNDGVGFKITFNDVATANKYKDMLIFIFQNDGYIIKNKKGYMDMER